jgi:oligopeptide transport system substrate-binding protein
VDLETREWKVYLANVKTRQYQVTRSGWIGDYHDPMTFLDLWTTGNGNNNTGWSDREYDALIERARRAGDPRVRFRLLSRAEKTLLTRGPVLPIYHYARSYLLNPAVRGFVPHRLDRHPIKYMRKVRPSPGTSPESAEAR